MITIIFKYLKIFSSEQQLVDCDTSNYGCGGGWMPSAWNYLQNKAKGSAKNALYPYTSGTSGTVNVQFDSVNAAVLFKHSVFQGGKCKFTSSMILAKVSTYSKLPNNATAMQVAVMKTGPISVALTVITTSNVFYNYA